MSLLQTIRSRIAPRPREARHAAGRDTALQAPTWHYVAAAVAILCNIAAASALQFFPYGDSPNHLARYTLIAASWRHAAPAWVTFNWAPTSYIAVDVMGAALVSVLGPAVANRLLTALYLAVLPLGMLALLRAVNPRSIAWSIVASLLAFNWCFLTGFYSYSLGVGLSLVWLAWWWPRRNDSSPVTRIVGMAAIVALYLVHMSAAAVALTAVAVACVEPVMSAPHDRAQWGRMIPRAVTTMLYASGPVLLNVLMRLRDARLVHPADTPVFRDPADKLRHALTPFASFSHAQTVLLLAMYAAALVIRLRACRPRFAQLKWPLITVALLGVYAVFPVAFLGAWDVDVRFLLPAYLLVFVIPGRRGSEPLAPR